MKNPIPAIVRFVKTHCPSVEHQYDVTTKVYKNQSDPVPAYTHTRKGHWHFNIWQGVALLSALIALSLSLSVRKK